MDKTSPASGRTAERNHITTQGISRKISNFLSVNMRHIKNIGVALMNLLKLKGVPILQQLHLEERLLRTSSNNWCITNDGTTYIPTIVMGFSRMHRELVEAYFRSAKRMLRERGGDAYVEDNIKDGEDLDDDDDDDYEEDEIEEHEELKN
ncbi:hypothetical protein LguiB_001333 [Lonicera macranthoides]